MNQKDLFGEAVSRPSLPTDYEPIRPAYFDVSRIYLARDSVATPERRLFVERICRLYPEAEARESLDRPHNRIELGESEAMGQHRLGKRTLVFGELKTAVRFSQEPPEPGHQVRP